MRWVKEDEAFNNHTTKHFKGLLGIYPKMSMFVKKNYTDAIRLNSNMNQRIFAKNRKKLHILDKIDKGDSKFIWQWVMLEPKERTSFFPYI